jgi:hypothetical protein
MDKLINARKGVLLFAINSTFHWWKNIGNSLSNEYNVKVITEHKTNVIDSIKNRFYFYLGKKNKKTLFNETEIDNVYDRCRVLRSLPKDIAVEMIISYENVFEELFSTQQFHYIFSFPIDRYPMDVLERVAKRYNIEYFEVTACLFDNTSMLLKRGKVVKFPNGIEKSISFDEAYSTLVSPKYTPVYVRKPKKYNKIQWLKVFLWQYARDIVFKLIMILERDRRSLHYIDSQMYLKHKVSLSDIFVNKYINYDYKEVMLNNPKEKNVIIALQLYPEASIDYWVEDMEIVNYEPFMLKLIKQFSNEGYTIFLKDHPLQFGFRQLKFIKDAIQFPNVHFLPYDSDINEILENVSISVTTTGTVGLQAALRGIISIVTPSYYSNSNDFIVLNGANDLNMLHVKVQQQLGKTFNLEERRNRLIEHLYDISLAGNIFSFRQKYNFEANISLNQLINSLKNFLALKSQ